MNGKVVDMMRLVEDGYEIDKVRIDLQGGVELLLRRGLDQQVFGFYDFELPAVLQECSAIGVAK